MMEFINTFYASRLGLYFLTYVELIMVSLSPTENNGMGTQKGDKPYKGGALNRFYYKRVLLFVLINYLQYTSIVFYGHLDVSRIEMMLFILTGVGWIIRMLSYAALGQFFTFDLGIRKDHFLITKGTYRFLVHPSYFGQVLCIFAGFSLLNMPYLLMLALAIFTLVRLTKRISMEEEMMKKEFGKEYEEYLAARWRIIPFVY